MSTYCGPQLGAHVEAQRAPAAVCSGEELLDARDVGLQRVAPLGEAVGAVGGVGVDDLDLCWRGREGGVRVSSASFASPHHAVGRYCGMSGATVWVMPATAIVWLMSAAASSAPVSVWLMSPSSPWACAAGATARAITEASKNGRAARMTLLWSARRRLFWTPRWTHCGAPDLHPGPRVSVPKGTRGEAGYLMIGGTARRLIASGRSRGRPASAVRRRGARVRRSPRPKYALAPTPRSKRDQRAPGGELLLEAVERAELAAEVVDHVHERTPRACTGTTGLPCSSEPWWLRMMCSTACAVSGGKPGSVLDLAAHAVVAQRDLALEACRRR